jgi:hypothetical protein
MKLKGPIILKAPYNSTVCERLQCSRRLVHIFLDFRRTEANNGHSIQVEIDLLLWPAMLASFGFCFAM